jgi:hypothetical protein
MFDGNAFLNELVGKNWMLMLLLFNVLTVIFPDAKWLKAIWKGFSKVFPVFKKKDQT